LKQILGANAIWRSWIARKCLARGAGPKSFWQFFCSPHFRLAAPLPCRVFSSALESETAPGCPHSLLACLSPVGGSILIVPATPAVEKKRPNRGRFFERSPTSQGRTNPGQKAPLAPRAGALAPLSGHWLSRGSIPRSMLRGAFRGPPSWARPASSGQRGGKRRLGAPMQRRSPLAKFRIPA